MSSGGATEGLRGHVSSWILEYISFFCKYKENILNKKIIKYYLERNIKDNFKIMIIIMEFFLLKINILR